MNKQQIALLVLSYLSTFFGGLACGTVKDSEDAFFGFATITAVVTVLILCVVYS